MTGVHQLGHNPQVYSVEGADAVIQSARVVQHPFRGDVSYPSRRSSAALPALGGKRP